VSAAPDLIAPVVGFRAWRVIDERLTSPYVPVRWEGRLMHAACFPANRNLTFGQGWLGEPHASPDPRCRCGIYAYHRPQRTPYVGEFEWVAGIVSVWGRVEVHRDGLRAEHARIEALAAQPGWGPARAGRTARIAERLEVDLVGHDELEAAAAPYGMPLPPSLVPGESHTGSPTAIGPGRATEP
jgi:hypothetical protein